MKNVLNRFELPVRGMERGKKFYSTIFDMTLDGYPVLAGPKMAMFPSEDGVGGALVQGEGYIPTHDGALIYLSGGDGPQVVQDRIGAAGGKVLQEKMSIGKNGFIAVFADTEGNKVSLHSMT